MCKLSNPNRRIIMKGRNGSFLLLGIAVLVLYFLVAPYGDRQLKADGTPALIILTNVATINWNGSGNAVASNMSLTVGTNYGATWFGDSNYQSVIAGSVTSNVSIFSNLGNSLSIDYIFTSKIILVFLLIFRKSPD